MTERRGRARFLGSLAALAVLLTMGTVYASPARAANTAAGLPRANPATGPVGPFAAGGGSFLTDRYGRVAILHGANLVYKVPPYEVTVTGRGPNVLTVREVKRMAALGFDVVRLGIIWKGLEPGTAGPNDSNICAPGSPRTSGAGQFSAPVFNRYIDRLDATVRRLASFGIYSLIDMHQDVYSEAFAGEGAPNWAVCTDGIHPQPKRNVPDWSINLKGPGVVQAYEHFWHNDVVGNLQGEFDSVWSRVATRFRDNPWVIGYDPFNEPWGQGLPPAGDGTTFDAELQCFYAGRGTATVNQSGQAVACPSNDPVQGVIPRIQAADPRHLVFYEPNYTTDSSVPSHIGPMPFGRLVLNTHDYCFLHVPNGPEPPGFAKTCGPLENAVFKQREAELSHDSTLEQPGGPALILTEFGATIDAADLARITADADAHLVGWMYWQWLHYQDPTGSHTSGLWPPTKATGAMLSVLSRPYARAIAGTPIAMSFDPKRERFTLDYRSNSELTQPTVVFVPRATHYNSGYCARAVGGRITSRPGATILDIRNEPRSTNVSLSIRKGKC